MPWGHWKSVGGIQSQLPAEAEPPDPSQPLVRASAPTAPPAPAFSLAPGLGSACAAEAEPLVACGSPPSGHSAWVAGAPSLQPPRPDFYPLTPSSVGWGSVSPPLPRLSQILAPGRSKEGRLGPHLPSSLFLDLALPHVAPLAHSVSHTCTHAHRHTHTHTHTHTVHSGCVPAKAVPT